MNDVAENRGPWSQVLIKYTNRLHKLIDGQDRCEVCAQLAEQDNPLYDFLHRPDCYVYQSSGACYCGSPGYLAHDGACPGSGKELVEG